MSLAIAAAYYDVMKKIAIVGYGNLGKACEKIALSSDAFELVGIFSRRRGLTSPYGTPIFAQQDIFDMAGDIDVAALCTGSANDLTGLGLSLAGKINTVDSFDTHAKMREYFEGMHARAYDNGKLSLVGIGWDPGLFSLCRALFEGVLPDGYTHTFWGEGVSQGHSEALRRIRGVSNAVQYTVPKQSALALAEAGEGRELTDRDKHLRVCYVAIEEGADAEKIEREIRTMPNYFAPYDVEIHFVSKEELARDHGKMPHGGRVTRFGVANKERCSLKLELKLDNNPDFTAGVLMRYVAACAKLNDEGVCGAKTILDIPVSALFENDDTLRFV